MIDDSKIDDVYTKLTFTVAEPWIRIVNPGGRALPHSGVSQSTKVVAGDGTDNTCSVDVGTTNWKLDEYAITVSGIEVSVTTTTNFNLVEILVTTTPTTAVPTETLKTPGFGAFIATQDLVQ